MIRCLTDVQESECCRRYFDGATLQTLGSELGCDPATVRNVLISCNVARRRCGRRQTCFRYVDAHGYVRVRNTGHRRAHKGFVYEHILVYEEAHGPVPDGCDVHHRNGIRCDNRLENLECLSHGVHMSLTRRYDASGGNNADPRVVRGKIGLDVAKRILPGFISSSRWYGEHDGHWDGKRVEVKASRMARTDRFSRWRFSYKSKERFDLLCCVLLDDEDSPICVYAIPSGVLPGDGQKYSGIWLRPEQERFSEFRNDPGIL